MEMKRVVARFMVHKVGSFVVKERVLCFGEYGFSTFDRENEQLTNTWAYEDVDGVSALEGETDFVIHTPRHRVKKTVYRCHYRMEVMVCLMRLRSQHAAKITTGQPPRAELQTHAFECVKYLRRDLQVKCIVEIRPDGVYQKDKEGELMSHIPYTSLVSIDVICDDHDAILLNHSDNSSLFVVPRRRTELAESIRRVMQAYGMPINEYRKKTLDRALKDDDPPAAVREDISCQYGVLKVSQSNESTATPRVLVISEKYIVEYVEPRTLISSRPLARVYSLIMLQDTQQAFEIVYVDGIRRKYYSEQREKIVCELLSSCHALGNHQVAVEMGQVPDWVQMVPRRIIQSEGAKMRSKVPDVSVQDRELRVAQSSILQLLAVHGYSKTPRVQRQLPRGLDEEMHSLAVELNVNTPTEGMVAQPNKPFEKVVFVVAREIHDIVMRHGGRHDFICTYLQTLYRVMLVPQAKEEFLRILNERGEEYISTITKILTSRRSVTTYWMLMVLHRLIESKAHKAIFRQIILSNNLFVVAILSLFDEDAQAQGYLSDLPTMKLCEFVLTLVKANIEKQHKLSEMLYQHLATKYRMMLRILFGFPALGTVEACVGILGRMTKNPAFLHFGNMSSPVRSRDGQIPRHTLSFGETMNYGVGANRGPLSSRYAAAPLSRNYLSSNRYNNTSSNRYNSTPSVSSVSSVSPGVVAVQNPEVLLKQYRIFVESSWGIQKASLGEHDEPVFLRLRYRCRNVFLQELMSHMVGNFEDFKRVYGVECHQFTGFLGSSDGQREKSDIFLTPRALIAVRVLNRNTNEFEFRDINAVSVAVSVQNAFAITVKGKIKYVYSDQSADILDKITDLAGVIGINLLATTCEKLPKPSYISATREEDVEPADVMDIQRRTGRHGFAQYRKKKLIFVDGALQEVADGEEKAYSLKELRRVVVPPPESDATETAVVLDFADGARIVYAPYDVDVFLAALYDSYRQARNWMVSLTHDFSRVNPRMTTRTLLHDDHERQSLLNQEGLYLTAHAALTKAIEHMSRDGTKISSAIEKVIFSLESMVMNVEMEDFAGKSIQAKLEQLSFASLLRGMMQLLENACKPPIRGEEVIIVLDSFCRINDGSYQLTLALNEATTSALVSLLSQVLVSGDAVATVWAMNAFHSLLASKARGSGQASAEKRVRFQVLENKKLIQLLVGVLEQRSPIVTLAMLELFIEVLLHSRQQTDNNQFEVIVKTFSSKYGELLRLASQSGNGGITASAICILKVVVDHSDNKTRHRIGDAALETGLTLKCFYKALFHPTGQAREAYQYISGIWMTHHKPSFEMLVRMLPRGFIRMLSHSSTRKLVRKERGRSDHTTKRGRFASKMNGRLDCSEVYIKRVQKEIASLFTESKDTAPRVKIDNARVNYPGESATDIQLLSRMVHRDFYLPDLIWNDKSRDELRRSLEKTIDEFDEFKSSRVSAMSLVASQARTKELLWNYEHFQVVYRSLASELEVGGFYARVLWERIEDGSVRLGEIAKIIHDNGAQNGFRGKIKGHSESFYACIEIVKNPAAFFNEVYQCWLENLYTTLSRAPSKDVASGRSSSLHNIASVDKYEQTGDWLLKLLIALARAFPGVGSVTKHRAQFLLSFLRSSYVSTDIHDVLELLGEVTGSVEAAERFCTRGNLDLFLYLSLLAHRGRRSNFGAVSSNVGSDDVPVMELQPMSDAGRTSSVPIAGLSFYDNSRFNLTWRVKVETNHEKGTSDSSSIVAGPFTAVSLREFLDTDPAVLVGDVQRISVCCCSLQDGDEHKHEWKSIFAVPELRWLELTDEAVDTECATFALKILRNFLGSKRAPRSPMCEFWPLPMATTAISSSSALPLLTQLLLVDDDIARSHVCEILLCLEDAVAENLYATGAFFFLLAADVQSASKGSFLAEARFLSKFHRVQRVGEKRYGQSCLLDILPESLIVLLDSDAPEHFADVFTSRKRDKRILWSPSMRQHLQVMLREHLRDFTNDLAQNVTTPYGYVSLPPVSYSELSGDVFCSGYYLSTFIQADADLESIEEPVILMSSIEDKWRFLVRRQSQDTGSELKSSSAFELFGWKEGRAFSMQDLRERYRELCRSGTDPSEARRAFDLLSTLFERKDEVDAGKTSDDVIDCILKAQLKLLEHFSIQFSSYYSKSLDLLLKTLTQPDKPGGSSAADFTSLAMKVLSRMLTAAPHNSARLLEIEGSWDAILETVEKFAFRRDIEAKELMFSILQLILASEGGMRSLVAANGHAASLAMPPSNFASRIHDEDDESPYFTATEYMSTNGDVSIAKYAERIYTLLDDVILSFENIQPWHIQKLSFDIVSEICRNLEVRDQILTTTRVFWKGLYLILASAASTEAEQSSGSNLEKQERDMLESAFRALRALAIGTDGTSRSKGLDALANLLPLDFLDCLDKPNGHEFCTIILSDIEEPSCVWNADTREELSLLTEEYCMSGNGDELSILESATSYMYDCLQSEPRVGGIYLNVLLDKGAAHPESVSTTRLFPASPTSFLEALFLFLSENIDPKLGIYSDTLPALECLSLLADVPSFRSAFVEVLEVHADDPDAANAAISVATLGRYLLPFDGSSDASKAVSISSRRSLSTYGFKSKHGGQSDAKDAAPSLESQFGNLDYQKRQELALLVLNKLCGFPCSVEKMMAPFCQYTWALQVITDHLGYEQAFYALSCLAELCDTCLTVAEYVEVSGLWVEILGLALQSRQQVLHEHFLRAEALREPAFEVIYALLDKDAAIRERMYSGLLRFLPYPVVYQIHLDPSKAARFFDDNHEKSDLIWNSHKRTEVRRKLDDIICRNRLERSIAKRDSVLLEDDDRIDYPSNFIGGLYLERFLSRPDPEKLTNPAYNLELLFQLWRTEMDNLMEFDLQNPPENLRVTADRVEKLTAAVTIILRAPLEIDDRISTSGMPEQIVQLVRFCNKHLITSFPYRCILRIARRLVQFPLLCSGEFLELLFCRMTIQHADIPSLVKLVRRILEARSASAAADGKKDDQELLLHDLKYYPQVVAFLEGLVADKDHIDGALLSNANRVLRILNTQAPKEESFKSMSRSFMGRWHNFTIAETRSSLMRASIKTTETPKPPVGATSARPSIAANTAALLSVKSFDVDSERMNGTFNVDEERKVGSVVPLMIPEDDDESFVVQAPPKSINYNGESLEVVDAVAPRSFRYSGNLPNDASLLSPMPMSMSATYDLTDSQYHSQKAEEYDVEVDIDELRAQADRRGSLPETPAVAGREEADFDGERTRARAPRRQVPMSGINPSTNYTDFTDSSVPLRSENVRDSDMTTYTNWSDMRSERRYSVLDSWKAPSSSQTNSSLMSMTITRRGRRAAATYSRNKSRQQKKWYSFKR